MRSKDLGNVVIEQNNKFKTGCIGCFFRLDLTPKNITISTLLAEVQSLLSEKYNTINRQSKRLSSLYDASLQIFPEINGNSIVMSYMLNFIEPREILDPEYDYANIMETFFSIVHRPLIDEKVVNLAKSTLHSNIRDFFELPENRALHQFMKLWFKNQPNYQYVNVVNRDILDQLSLEDIQDFVKLLFKSPLMIYGQVADTNLFNKIGHSYFNIFKSKADFVNPQLVVDRDIDTFDESSDAQYEQAQVLMGYFYNHIQSMPRPWIGPLIMSYYLANTESSILFKKVREQLGATYGVDAFNDENHSLLLIRTGVNKNQVKQVKEIIQGCLSDLVCGLVDQEAFDHSKQLLINNFNSYGDIQESMMIKAVTENLIGSFSTIPNMIKLIKDYTVNDLINLAKTMQLNGSYCLL